VQQLAVASCRAVKQLSKWMEMTEHSSIGRVEAFSTHMALLGSESKQIDARWWRAVVRIERPKSWLGDGHVYTHT
jgi:hypothetical protein